MHTHTHAHTQTRTHKYTVQIQSAKEKTCVLLPGMCKETQFLGNPNTKYRYFQLHNNVCAAL